MSSKNCYQLFDNLSKFNLARQLIQSTVATEESFDPNKKAEALMNLDHMILTTRARIDGIGCGRNNPSPSDMM